MDASVRIHPKITAIDDQSVLQDPMNTINLYHLLDSSHSRTQLMIYYANARDDGGPEIR